jgi:hypothetical protein
MATKPTPASAFLLRANIATLLGLSGSLCRRGATSIAGIVGLAGGSFASVVPHRRDVTVIRHSAEAAGGEALATGRTLNAGGQSG